MSTTGKSKKIRKLICHAEFIIGENLTQRELDRLMDKEFDRALFFMTDGLDLEIESDMIYVKKTERNNSIINMTKHN